MMELPTDDGFDKDSWRFHPKNLEEYDRCTCSCHSCPGAVHCVPCCQGGWKLNSLGRSRLLEKERNKGSEE